HAEDEDGGDALPDEASAQGRHRDGAARTRLQSHPRHEHHGHSAADGRHPGIVKSPTTAGFTSSCSSNILRQNVFTRPRPDSDIGRAANVAPAPPSGKLVLASTMLSNVADMRRREFSCAASRWRGRKRSKGERV